MMNAVRMSSRPAPPTPAITEIVFMSTPCLFVGIPLTSGVDNDDAVNEPDDDGSLEEALVEVLPPLSVVCVIAYVGDDMPIHDKHKQRSRTHQGN